MITSVNSDSMTTTEALNFLGAVVEMGLQPFDNLPDVTPEFIRKELDTAIEQARGEFFKDEFFGVSLQIGVTKLFEEYPQPAAYRSKFRERLEQIFPADLARALFDYVFDRFKEHPLTKEALAKHDEKHRQFLGRERFLEEQRLNNVRLAQRGKPLPWTTVRGTTTWLVPCPHCGEKKRCDEKMKRFRCRCGFDKPYPF